jgi:hypothetical protein
MQSDATNSSEARDWRLEGRLDVVDHRQALEDLIGRLHKPALVEEVAASVPDHVVVTYDGNLLFAYASDETALKAARSAIETVLQHDGITATVKISHWDERLDEWQQTDPPASAQEQRVEDAADHEAETIETRTLVASAGKLIRAEFEQTMLNRAGELDLKCQIIEHPHLLTTQVGFTVTGSRRKLDEFSQGLIAEGRAFIRTETAVMMSPL